MSKDNGEHGELAEPAVSKEPSFRGRLQLKDFVSNASANTATSSGVRRSPRLRISQYFTAASSDSPTPAPGTPPKPKPSVLSAAQKRKSQSDTLTSQSSQTSLSKSNGSPSPGKKRARVSSSLSSSYAPPSTYAHLPPLVDVITPNLLILFIGLNPGVQTARSGHAYAHPSNLFWKLLYSSGITPVPCKPQEDRTLPERFSLGNTNIVSRPSRNGAELSKGEMDEGVAVLEAKCRRWRPEVVCIVGKSIWESIFRVWKGRNMKKGEFEYGWQTERMGAVPPARNSASVKIGAKATMNAWVKKEVLSDGEDDGDENGGEGEGVKNEQEREETVDDGPWEGSRIFVATSTSGLAATLPLEEKQRIWKILGDWCVQRRKERAEEAQIEIKTPLA
ncbi:DNA glycosylase [Xylariaceae sp. FL1651]|nr:DNA glycosylase [Xylariaceae sp. FL1651]